MKIPPYPITAYSLCNCLGSTTEAVLDAFFAGRTGLTPCRLELPFDTWVGAVEEAALLPLASSLADRDTRQARMTALTYQEMADPVAAAIERWGAHRIAIVLGSSTGGIRRTEESWGRMLEQGEDQLPDDYNCLQQHVFSASARVLAEISGVTGPAYMISTACTSSAKVLGAAQRLLAANVVDAVLTGGVDTLCRFTVAGFRSLQVLSEERCRPFSSERNGINIGEGGALMLLEREASGPDHPARGWLYGAGETSDAYHMTSPHPEGVGAIAAMQKAVERSGLTPEDIDWINAHGTATQLNDESEANAVAAVFRKGMPVVGTKGYTGHQLGACGATEVLFSVASMERGLVPATVGAEPVEESLPVSVIREPEKSDARYVLSNSFAFGGNNFSVVIGRADQWQ